MNIVEAYIKFNKQLIILVSGISGCGKSALAKNIAGDFKIVHIDQHNYYKKDWDTKIKITDTEEIINYDTDDAVDWERFNGDINKIKANGVVVSGFSLPSEVLNFKPNFHIHLNISKQQCLQRREVFYKENKEIIPHNYNFADEAMEKLKFNKYTYPYYLETMKKMHITKFYNVMDKNDDQIYDDIFDSLIEAINRAVYKTNEQSRQFQRSRHSKRFKGHHRDHRDHNIQRPIQLKKDDTEKPQVLTRKGKYEITGSFLSSPKPTYDDELDMITKYETSVSEYTQSSDFDPDDSTSGEEPIKRGRIGFIYTK